MKTRQTVTCDALFESGRGVNCPLAQGGYFIATPRSTLSRNLRTGGKARSSRAQVSKCLTDGNETKETGQRSHRPEVSRPREEARTGPDPQARVARCFE
jgi:hypothetical protein